MKNIKGKYWQDSNTKQVYRFPKSGKGDPRPFTVTDIIQNRKLVGSESLPKEVKDSAMQVEGIEEVDLDLVFEPPWNKDMMSEAAKLELNL